MSISILQYNVTGDCENLNVGAVYLQVSGDTPPFAVNCISPSCPLPTSALTAPYIYSYENISGGTYFLQITDGSSAFEIKSVYISTGTTVSIDSSNTTCGIDNGTVTGFTSGVYGFSTFVLFDGDDNYINSGTSVSTDYTFTSLSAGTYYVSADDGGGCKGKSASVIINPSNPFTFSGYVVNDASCLGTGSGKIFLTGLTLPVSAYTINWNPSLSPQTGATVTGLTAGIYNVKVVDPNGCLHSESFTVNTVTPVSSGGFIVINQPTCFQNDGEVEFIVLNGTPPYFFSASTGQVEITFGSSVNFTGLTSGSYSFLVTDAGLCTDTGTVELITPNAFSIVSISTINSNQINRNTMASKEKQNTIENMPTLMLDGGLKYKGQVKSGVPHGQGKLVWPNGDFYKGEFKNGKRHGKGKRLNKDGSNYIGEYEEDQPSGKGRY